MSAAEPIVDPSALEAPAPLPPPPAETADERLLPWVHASRAPDSGLASVSECLVRRTGLLPFYQAKTGPNAPEPGPTYASILTGLPGLKEVPEDKFLKRLVYGMDGEGPVITPFSSEAIRSAIAGMQPGTLPPFDVRLLGLEPEAGPTVTTTALRLPGPVEGHPEGEKRHKSKKKKHRSPEEQEERQRRKMRKLQERDRALREAGGHPPLSDGSGPRPQ